jgi:hypothetical protein
MQFRIHPFVQNASNKYFVIQKIIIDDMRLARNGSHTRKQCIARPARQGRLAQTFKAQKQLFQIEIALLFALDPIRIRWNRLWLFHLIRKIGSI